MPKSTIRLWLAMLLGTALSACSAQMAVPARATAGEVPPQAESWLRGGVDERLETVAAQLGGFGTTMMEVGYRYGELYFAGDDENWDYARHQIEEIEGAMAKGLQRRPARAASAAMLNPALDTVKAAVASGDEDAFEDAFETLTNACNACHVAEKASFIRVAPPEHRVGPVRSNAHADR